MAGVRSLARAAPTRWGTIQDMCKTILYYERAIHAIVTARDFIVGTTAQKQVGVKIKAIISNNKFVSSLTKCLVILSPIDLLIVKYQFNSVPVSEVLPNFNALSAAFTSLQRDGGLISNSELLYIINLSLSLFS